MRRLVFQTVLAIATAMAGCTADPGNNGNLDGSADATTSDAWLDPAHLPDGAPNPCLGATTCDECTARTPCGWCGDRCLSGSADHSDDLTCSGPQWAWRGVQCPGTGTQCAAHTDCLSCAMDENSCGWCANSGQCTAGDSVGPAQPIDGCSPTAGTWIYNTMTMTCP